MTSNYYVGQRVSFSNSSGTVRFIGPIDGLGQDNIRLGVEWDNPARGKHDGQYKGKRYFECLSASDTGGSFMRLNAAHDQAQSFVEAVREKYAPPEPRVPTTEHVISGKVAEEIGFDKIKKQQAQLHKLTVVLVDGLRISSAELQEGLIRETSPRIAELDLSRNLFEDFEVIVKICGELVGLKSLRLNNNKFSKNVISYRKEFEGITHLEQKEMFLPFIEMICLARQFPSLKDLDLSSNALSMIPCPIQIQNLTSLALEFNEFSSLSQLSQLASLESLKSLKLKGNQIYKTSSSAGEERDTESMGSKAPLVFGSKLQFVDLAYNEVSTWDFVDDLATIFPGLTALRLSQNPIHSKTAEHGLPAAAEDPSMVTIARLGALRTLDYRDISTEYRTNSEGFYLSLIGKAMAEVPENEEHSVTSKHPRYEELCAIHGTPAFVRKSADVVNPNFLEARLINFEFYAPPQAGRETEPMWREIPKSFDVYRVKGIVGRMFNLLPHTLKLTWETGIWDPVAGYEEDDYNSDDEDTPEQERVKNMPVEGQKERQGKWILREVEIEDSTRQIGVCVDGEKAKVRVESFTTT